MRLSIDIFGDIIIFSPLLQLVKFKNTFSAAEKYAQKYGHYSIMNHWCIHEPEV